MDRFKTEGNCHGTSTDGKVKARTHPSEKELERNFDLFWADINTNGARAKDFLRFADLPAKGFKFFELPKERLIVEPVLLCTMGAMDIGLFFHIKDGKGNRRFTRQALKL